MTLVIQKKTTTLMKIGKDINGMQHTTEYDEYDINRHDNNKHSNNTKHSSTCCFFQKGNCKHGLRGRECKCTHPKMCRRFMQHGTRQPRGCTQGKRCNDFHPKMSFKKWNVSRNPVDTPTSKEPEDTLLLAGVRSFKIISQTTHNRITKILNIKISKQEMNHSIKIMVIF